jgi:branched-chain amino acid transport system substrate-binding protein
VTVDNGKRKDYVFRACFIDPFQGTVMAKFALNDLKAKKADILFDKSNAYTVGLADNFKAQFVAGGGTVAIQDSYGKDDVDFSSLLTKIAADKPDVLFLPDYYNKVNLIAKQAKEKGITAPMGGGDGWDSADLDVKAVDGGFYSNHYDPADPRPVVQNFLKAYAAAYNGAVPDALATLGYDATNMMLTAVKNAGSNDPDKVKAALEGINFSGVSGNIKLVAQHNPIKAAVVIAVKDGKKTYKETVNP